MKFTPIDEAQAAKELLLPAGEYPFIVSSAEEQMSKAGNPMLKIKLTVKGRLITDFLLESMKFKLIHFARSVNMVKEYEAGELTSGAVCLRKGILKLDIEEQLGYQPKNVVKDYLVAKDAKPPVVPEAAKPAANAETDEPPF